jgi:hypothetical protein
VAASAGTNGSIAAGVPQLRTESGTGERIPSRSLKYHSVPLGPGVSNSTCASWATLKIGSFTFSDDITWPSFFGDTKIVLHLNTHGSPRRSFRNSKENLERLTTLSDFSTLKKLHGKVELPNFR